MARFLVVDRDRATISALTKLLTDDGHGVVGCSHGPDAVAALRGDSFDAVVTSVDLPDVGGDTVARAARERCPRACVVVVSARTSATLRQRAGAGRWIVMEKPLDYERLLHAVARWQPSSLEPPDAPE